MAIEVIESCINTMARLCPRGMLSLGGGRNTSRKWDQIAILPSLASLFTYSNDQVSFIFTVIVDYIPKLQPLDSVTNKNGNRSVYLQAKWDSMIAFRLQLNSGRSATYQDDFQHAVVSLYGGWLPIRQQKMEKHGEIPSGGRCRICTLSQRMLSIEGYGLIYWGGVALVITWQSTDWAATIASVNGAPTQANPHPTLFSYNNFKKSERPRNRSSTHTTEETTPKRPWREPLKPRSLLINRSSLSPTLSLPGLKLTKVASHSGDVASYVEVAAEPPPVEQNCNGKWWQICHTMLTLTR